MRGTNLVSKKFLEFLHANTDLAQNGSQGARIDFRVVGDHRLCEGQVSAEDDVAAVLPAHAKTESRQRGHDLPPGNPWRLAHTAMIKASNLSCGTANPSSLSTCT